MGKRTNIFNKIAPVIMVLLVFGFAEFLVDNSNNDSAQSSFNEATTTRQTAVIVERVVDGDTLVVSFDNGHVDYVRLIGIDAPESVHEDATKNTEEGIKASEFLKSVLGEGIKVYLEKDISDTDQYGRLLRYVWIDKEEEYRGLPIEGIYSDDGKVLLNGLIVASGYAQSVRFEPDTERSACFDAAQQYAIEHNLGVSYLWAQGQ